MKPSLTKLVDVIMQKLAERPDWGASESGIRSWLMRQGYAKRDIDSALRLVRPRFDRSEPVETGSGRVRHFSEYEQYRLSAEARDALTRLELYELIEPFEREMILERLDQFEGEVTLGDLDYLVNWMICPTRDIESQQTLFNVLDGTRGNVH